MKCVVKTLLQFTSVIVDVKQFLAIVSISIFLNGLWVKQIPTISDRGVEALSANNYFAQKEPSQMFYMALNTPLPKMQCLLQSDEKYIKLFYFLFLIKLFYYFIQKILFSMILTFCRDSRKEKVLAFQLWRIGFLGTISVTW